MGACKVYARQKTQFSVLLRYAVFCLVSQHTLLNIYEMIENVSLVKHLNVGFHKDALRSLLMRSLDGHLY